MFIFLFIVHCESCGKPFPIVDWIIVDVDTNKVLPAGEVGELLMKSPLIMSHYHNKPDNTAEALVFVEGTLGEDGHEV